MLLLPAKYTTFKVLSSVLDKAWTKGSNDQKLTIKALRKQPVLKLRFRILGLQNLSISMTSHFKSLTRKF